MDAVQDHAADAGDGPCEFVALQPVAVVDHLCAVDEATLRSVINGEIGGSSRIGREQVAEILAAVGEFHSKAGGSAANTTRGLAAGFGVRCGVVGARGLDENGAFYQSSMARARVRTDRLRALDSGATGRSVVMMCDGQRTMRTCLDGAARLGAADLTPDDFAGASWAFFSGYSLYSEGLLPAAVALAAQAGAKLALDLASFEVVRSFRRPLLALLEAHRFDFVTCNEDEAVEVLGGAGSGRDPEAALEWLAARARIAVVTLGGRGCIVRAESQAEVLREPAASGVTVVDATGAGDLFAAGFLYGLMRDYPLQRCAQIGCLAGGAVIQSVGAELSPANWRWLFARLHGELAAGVVRDSALAVSAELLECYALIERLGRGVVYYGSARLKQESPHWDRAVALGRDVSKLLGVTTWSGGGPGMMEAATRGALEAGGRVGGIRISREAGQAVRTAQSYLPEGGAVFCRFLSSRKVALVDSGVRVTERDRGAYIFLPGGLGTMDEFYELTTLVQLKKLGTKLPVPIIVVNWDGFYEALVRFLRACCESGTVGAAELQSIIVADSSEEVLGCLAEVYGLPYPHAATGHSASELISQRGGPPVADIRQSADAAAASSSAAVADASAPARQPSGMPAVAALPAENGAAVEQDAERTLPTG